MPQTALAVNPVTGNIFPVTDTLRGIRARTTVARPQYRERYAANLRRELPSIPFAPDFHAFAAAGKQLADLHIGYEQAKEHSLTRREKPDT